MSCVQSSHGRGTRQPRGGKMISCSDIAMNQKTYRPSGEGQRHIEHPSVMASEMQPRYYKHGQQKLPLPPPRSCSPHWHEGRSLADSDTLPARWRNECQPVDMPTQHIDQGQSRSEGAKVYFQRSAERRQRISEDGEEEGELISSSDDSLEGSLTIVEKYESELDDRHRTASHCFDVIDNERAESGDEDGFVHVPRGSPRVGAREGGALE